MSEFREQIEKILNKKQSVSNAIPAQLGDGDNNVVVSGMNNYVYYRIGDRVGIAYNNVIGAENDQWVWIASDPEEPQKMRVLSKLSSRSGYGDGDQNYHIGKHADQHRYPNNDTVYVEARQLMPLRITPLGGFLVNVNRGIVKLADGYHVIDSETLDLSGYQIYADAGAKAKWLTIEVDSSASLAVVEGTEVNLDALAESNIPDPSNGGVDIGAVRIYSGQTDIVEARTQTDIFDPRFVKEVPSAHAAESHWEPITFDDEVLFFNHDVLMIEVEN